MQKQKQEVSLGSLMTEFHSDDQCRAYLEELRWPDGITCPKCESKSVSRITTRNQLDCNTCRCRFSVTSGTIFHDSHLPLWKWFAVTYLMIEAKKGVSALQIKRTLDIAYQTSWHLCHRIRKAMTESYPYPPLKGIVEVDETWIGGKAKGKGRGFTGNKAIVAGAFQRGGKIVLKVVKGRDRKALHQFVKETAAPDTEAIFTDDWRPYRGVADADTRHETVNHSAGEYVRGDVHTNNIEMIWQLFKRSVVGSYHQLSKKHMDRYLDELEWRFNNRENPWLFRDTMKRLLASDKLEYKTLTA